MPAGPAGDAAHAGASLLGLLRWVGARLVLLPRAGAAVLALGWAALIHRLSSQPFDSVPRGGLWAFASNAAHVPLFGLLALWLALALPRARGESRSWPALTRRAAALVLLAVALYGALDEWHQSTTGRTPSVLDWATDVAAAAWVVLVAAHAGRGEATPSSTAARFAGGMAAALGAAALATWA